MLKETMINRLPEYERKSKIIGTLLNSEAAELQLKYEDIDDFLLQLSVDTATWGLAIYESDLKIPTDNSKPYEYRRSVIKSKMRASGKLDRLLIKLTCDAFTNGNVVVSFNGHIIVKFTSVRGIPPNMSDLQAVLEEIKPAHLGIDYEFTYTTWGEVKAITWMNAATGTWEDLKTRVVV